MTALNPPNNPLVATTPRRFAGPTRPSSAASQPPRARDRIDIPSLAALLDRLRQMDGTRSRKVEAIKLQVVAGTYEMDEKLDTALGSLLADLA